MAQFRGCALLLPRLQDMLKMTEHVRMMSGCHISNASLPCWQVSFLLYLEASHETMKQRIQGRAASNPGRVDDNDETVKKRLEVFDSQTVPLVNYYGPIGKLRRANAETLAPKGWLSELAWFMILVLKCFRTVVIRVNCFAIMPMLLDKRHLPQGKIAL